MIARSLNARSHVNKIVALAGIYGAEKVVRALEDAIECHAYPSEYIENILPQREHHAPQPGPLHPIGSLAEEPETVALGSGKAAEDFFISPEKRGKSEVFDTRISASGTQVIADWSSAPVFISMSA